MKSNLTSIFQRVDKQILCMMFKRFLNTNANPHIESTGITRSNKKKKISSYANNRTL